MTETEALICARVRIIRADLHWLRPIFAAELNITRNRLESVELARTPLAYDVGARICEVFNINQGWLVTGRLPKYGALSLLGTFPPRALFSAVYQAHLAPQVEKWQASRGTELERLAKRNPAVQMPKARFAPTAAGRKVAEFVLKVKAAEWLLQVPDDRLSDFVNAVHARGEELIQAYPEESLDILRARLDALLREDNEFNRKQRQLTQYLFGPSKDCKDHLDNKREPDNLCGMISTWEDLRARLRKRLVARGAQANLARVAGVSRQLMSQYLVGKFSPPADTTLFLLNWVLKPEARNQQESPSSVSPPKGQRTQRTKHHESTSDPNSEKH